MSTRRRVILFAGGGTGGHIFPNLAIAQRLRDLDDSLEAHFIVSNRSLDAEILRKASAPFTALSARPFSVRPWRWPGFALAWERSMASMQVVLREYDVRVVVATGGFVSAPAAAAARRAQVPVALVNLDAAPGKANRWLARQADALFSVHPIAGHPAARIIGMPLRREALCDLSPAEARSALGMSPDRPTLLVTGGSQGASSLNELMIALAREGVLPRAWQVFHLAGAGNHERLSDAYRQAAIPARVLPFWDAIGQAWRGADMAIARGGASTCAEAWTNACPALVLPYPHHRDEHQRLNALPLVQTGGALLYKDAIDPARNAATLAPVLRELLADPARLRVMAAALRRTAPPDGAAAVAAWVLARG